MRNMKRGHDFVETLERRVSCREFIPNSPLRKSEIDDLLRAAIRAPTAGNLQAWRVFLVEGVDKLTQLRDAARGQDWIPTASLGMIFFADQDASARKYRSRGTKLYSVQDATIACAYTQLCCEFLGLGACWVGAFSETRTKALAGVEDDDSLVPISLLIIGRPTPTARKRPRSRRSVDEVVIPDPKNNATMMDDSPESDG